MTRLTVLGGLALSVALSPAWAEVSSETVKALGAPDRLETSVGTLDFKDGAPSADTAQKVFDALDFTRALNAYNNSFRGASALAIVKGVESLGAKPGDVVITVNGYRLERPKQFMAAWAALGKATRLDFEILRDGKPQHVLYRIVEK